MDWLLVSAGACLTAAALVSLSRRRRRGGGAEIVFELRLPSRWAAELTARVAEHEGRELRIARRGAAWICRVTRSLPSGPDGIDAICRRLHQIAATRGGTCSAHIVTRGGRTETHRHRQRRDAAWQPAEAPPGRPAGRASPDRMGP